MEGSSDASSFFVTPEPVEGRAFVASSKINHEGTKFTKEEKEKVWSSASIRFDHHGAGLLPEGSALFGRQSTTTVYTGILGDMTKLLDQALEAVRRLPPREQDDIARVIMQLAGSDIDNPVSLSPDEREAIARSKAAAARGEFATDEQVRAVWAKHRL